MLAYTGILFEYWRDYRDGKMTRERFVAWMAPLRQQMEAIFEKAVALDIKGLSGSCANVLEHRQALWTFVERDDVEPTNNHGERELRAFVLWRKRSFGTQSKRGNRFAERVMTIAHTARKQDRNVLAFLTACCRARSEGSSVPSLFSVDAAWSLRRIRSHREVPQGCAVGDRGTRWAVTARRRLAQHSC